MPLDIRQKPKSTNTSPQYHSHHNSTVSSPASHKSSGGGGVQGRRSTFPVSYDRKSTTPQEHKTQLIKTNASPNHSISVGSPSHHRLSKTSIRTTPNKSNTSPLSHHTVHSYNISSTTTSPSHSRLLYQTQSPITTISPNSSNYEVIYSPEIKTLNSTINSPTNSHEVRRSMPLPLSKIDLTSPTNRPLNRLIRTPSPNSIPNSRTPTPLSRPTSTSPSRQTSPRPNPSPRKVNQHTYNTPTRIAHSPSISRGVRKEEYISPAARARSSSIASYNRESPRSQSRERILSPTASSIAKHHNEYELAPSYRNLRYTSPMNKDRRESGPTPISTSNDPNPHRHSPKVGHSRPPVYQYESIDSKSPKYKVIPRGSKSATNSPANKERPSVKRIANTPPPNSGRLSHDLLEKYEESMLDGTRDRSQHYHVIQRSASPMSPKRSEQPLSPNSHGLSYREDVIIDSYASPTHSTSLNRVIISSSPTSYPPTFPKSPNTSRSASPSRTWIFANDPTFILSEQQQQHIIKRSQTTPSPSRCDPPPQVVYDTSWRSSTPPRHEVNDVFDRVQFSPNRTETPTRTNPSPFDYHYVPLERQRWSSSKQLDLVKYATIDTSGSPTTTTVNDIFDSIKSPISVGSSSPKEEIERKYEKPVHRTSEADRMSVTSLGSSGSRGGFKDKISRGRLDEARHVGDGIATGGRFLVDSFARGVSGVVTKPIQGAREDGARGFVTGLGKGVVGLVTKPVRGVVGFTAQTLEGVVNTPSAVRSAMRKKSGEINSPRRSSIVSINSPRRGSIQAINSPTSTESSSMQSDRQQMSA